MYSEKEMKWFNDKFGRGIKEKEWHKDEPRILYFKIVIIFEIKEQKRGLAMGKDGRTWRGNSIYHEKCLKSLF